jgi:hypothetical protein
MDKVSYTTLNHIRKEWMIKLHTAKSTNDYDLAKLCNDSIKSIDSVIVDLLSEKLLNIDNGTSKTK